MRDWSLSCATTATGPGDPLSLTLAADMRLCTPDYLNDHIWELEIGGGEPASMAVRTTYGLRARYMRLFCRFSEAGTTVTNPANFVRAPRLRRFYPNFLWLDFVPLEGLEVTAEYWVPESHVLAGRVTMTNRATTARKMDFDLCGALTPLDGKSLSLTQQQMVNVLAGRTGGLMPVLFLSGGPMLGPGPHPSLALKMALEPGQTRSVVWCLAAEDSTAASFELARKTAARPWDAERARIEMLDAGDTLEIHTGDPDWDAALAFSQRQALSCFFPGGEHFPQPSFVIARQPDSGYSRSGTGMDHPAGWNGQTAFETYYAASLLPAARRLRRGLIQNYLKVQTEDGFIDGKPGLAGQRARFLAAPLLASVAWNYYQDSQDDAFLEEVFPGLYLFFEKWFTAEHDRDGDGIPEWNHVLQTGFEDHPLFDTWHPWSQGLPISALFNPELEALLYREATALIRMAEKLGRAPEIGQLHERAATLRSAVEAGWNAEKCLYVYRDRVTGLCSIGQLVAKRKGPGEMRPRKAVFDEPVRLLIEVQTEEPGTRRPFVQVTGLGVEPVNEDGERKQREILGEEDFQWRAGGLTAISKGVYCKVGHITASGLEEQDKLAVRSIDATPQDVTLFTPLWARIPQESRAESMIRGALLDGDRFERPFGIHALGSIPDPRAEGVAMSVHMPWNQMIGEGLLEYGYRAEAARLTEKLMQAVIQCLKQSRGFYEQYHAGTGNGIGERGALTGLAPVGLFLQVLGVQIVSPTIVHLEGKNPFAWPVTILYKGLKVVRGLEETEVIFPNGKSVKLSGEESCMVTL
jgi:hypothetical protein